MQGVCFCVAPCRVWIIQQGAKPVIDLGSASVVADECGEWIGEQRYYPFGEARLSASGILTDQLFTGQREMAGLGIYHYGARFYSPYINRFLSADTIIPGGVQGYDRYAYVNNNPLRFTDPTGHMMQTEDGGGKPKKSCPSCAKANQEKVRKQRETDKPIKSSTYTQADRPVVITNPLPPVVSQTQTPIPLETQTPVPLGAQRNFEPITTLTPTRPPGWIPSRDPEWFQYVDEQDMILDVSGLGLDLITRGTGGRVTNALQVLGKSLDWTDATFGAVQTIQDTSGGSADWYTYASFTTDIFGLRYPVILDAVGITFNIFHAHQLANQYP
jgi:RHS repeat-associated protein